MVNSTDGAKKPVVIANKLSFKGSSSSKFSSKNSTAKPANNSNSVTATVKSAIVLTEAQKRHNERKINDEARSYKKLIEVPYRDRVEAFNARLATMTEHNDIPRISAAGNG